MSKEEDIKKLKDDIFLKLIILKQKFEVSDWEPFVNYQNLKKDFKIEKLIELSMYSIIKLDLESLLKFCSTLKRIAHFFNFLERNENGEKSYDQGIGIITKTFTGIDLTRAKSTDNCHGNPTFFSNNNNNTIATPPHVTVENLLTNHDSENLLKISIILFSDLEPLDIQSLTAIIKENPEFNDESLKLVVDAVNQYKQNYIALTQSSSNEEEDEENNIAAPRI